MKISALPIAILIVAPSVFANTVILTTTQNLGPGPSMTYIEVVTSGPTPTSVPGVSESSTGCYGLVYSGCSLGMFDVALPTLNLPSGSAVTDATLQVAFTPEISDSGIFFVSSVPIDPTQPGGGGGSAGSHYEALYDTTNTAVGNSNVRFGAIELTGNSTSVLSFDYTAPTETAVQTASPLAPITIDLIFNYGFQTAQSAESAPNSITTFNEDFSFLSSPVVSTLNVDYTLAPVPEPSSWTLALTGAFALIWIAMRGRRSLNPF
jgi:hypothetical protein